MGFFTFDSINSLTATSRVLPMVSTFTEYCTFLSHLFPVTRVQNIYILVLSNITHHLVGVSGHRCLGDHLYIYWMTK